MRLIPLLVTVRLPSPVPVAAYPDTDLKKQWGTFGRINVSTTPAEVHDGLSGTIMTGELQRIVNTTTAGPFNASTGLMYGQDGWAVGGVPTLFCVGYMVNCATGSSGNFVATGGHLMNNGFYGSPGSQHPGGANFGFGDGSVRYMLETTDPNIFCLMGSMDDGVPIHEEE